MHIINEFSLENLLSYIKGTPAILGILITSLIAIIVVILGRLKQWLITPKNTFIFSLISSLLVTIVVFILYYFLNTLPNKIIYVIIYFIILFISLTTVIFLSIFLTTDKTAMGKHENQLDKDIPEPNFNDRLKRVTEALSLNLRDIDIQTNWSLLNFVPLEAEVELIKEGKSREKRVTDLLKAIKRSKTERLFLVIGDPGSGKSVALRKLCQDLSKEVKKTGKIPIYINLKEWQQKWDKDNPPTVEQLNDFVLKNLKKRDIVTTEFFNKYYTRLYEQGRLYFVFDSFDEIPSVLGEQESSLLIRQLSTVMHDFLRGARQQSQGILASRIFRRPTNEFQTKTVLEIRPFSETKINQVFYKTLGYDEVVVKQLFRERFDLLNAATNPFTASLLANYAKDHQNNLTSTLLNLYESYFNGALNNSYEVINDNNLSVDVVEKASIQIANLMFANYGFEIPISVVKERISPIYRSKVDSIIDILQFARIGRRSRETGLFSFSHRRFCEFFVVKQMVVNEQGLHLEDIPKDSQWRDALVMYCQVATDSQATLIANYCWSIIYEKDNPFDLESIHCMRFLRDAFKTRLNVINSFKNDLSSYILKQIGEDKNMLTAKLSVECLGLLEEKYLDEGATHAMISKNVWLVETSIKSCRTLSKISSELSSNMREYISDLNLESYIKIDNDLIFSLSLSLAMRDIKIAYKKLIIDTWLIVALFVIIILLNFNNYNFILPLLLVVFVYILTNIFRKFGILFPSFFLRNYIWIYMNFILFFTLYSIIQDFYVVFLLILLIFVAHLYCVFPVLSFYKTRKTLMDLQTSNILFFMGFLGIILFFGIFLIGIIYLINNYLSTEVKIFLLIIVMALNLFYFVFNFLTIHKFHRSIKKNLSNNREYIYSIFVEFNNLRHIHMSRIKFKNKPNLLKMIINVFLSTIFAPVIFLDKYVVKFYLHRYIEYLESNIQKVDGKWPNDNLFSVSNKDREYIRLAVLEEKWLGISR